MRESDAVPSFVPVEELFAGRHFDAEIGVLSASLREPPPLRISSAPAAAEPMSDRYQAVAQSPIC